MGASGWHYFVPHEPDLARALQRLREDIFRKGAFHRREGGKVAPSIEALLEENAEDGTHSAIDIDRIVDEPLPEKSEQNWRPDVLMAFWSAAAPLAESELVERFGSARPDHATVERGIGGLMSNIWRGCAVYVLVWADAAAATPSEILFVGVTGD